ISVIALLAAAAPARADMFVNAKTFSTQEATQLARSTIATFSDDKGAGPCSANGYASTVDWGDGRAVEPATVSFRFGGDFTLCEFTVSAEHRYAHFGIYTTRVAVSGGPPAHTRSRHRDNTRPRGHHPRAVRPVPPAAGP